MAEAEAPPPLIPSKVRPLVRPRNPKPYVHLLPTMYFPNPNFLTLRVTLTLTHSSHSYYSTTCYMLHFLKVRFRFPMLF